MSSSLRRGGLGAAAIALSIAPLSACAAGNDAQTLEIKPDNAATTVGDIKIQNATVITQPGLTDKGPAVVMARIFNDGDKDQTLQSVTLTGKATAKLSPAKGERRLLIPAHGWLALGGKGNASAVVADGRKAATDGNAQPIVFDLSSTGEVPMRALVVPAKHYFKEWGPSTPPSLPSVTPSSSASSGGGPSGTPSGEAGTPPGGDANGKGDGRGGKNTTPPKGQQSGGPSGTPSSQSGGDAIVEGDQTPSGGAH